MVAEHAGGAAPAIRVAIAGNPNTGKTCIFNALTGSRQRVANYPGVTVARKEGAGRHGDRRLTFVDLPGTYSLTAYTIEERIARDVILRERPDVVVDVLDATNLERHLYLATQLMELGVPLVLALNMSDMAAARGMAIDVDRLSALLGVPIVPTVGHRGQGIEALCAAIVARADAGSSAPPHAVPRYGHDVEAELARLIPRIEAADAAREVPAGARWLTLKLLEQDADIRERIADPDLLADVDASIERVARRVGEAPEVLIADHRYGFITGACQQVIPSTPEARVSVSDRIDVLLTHRALGLPIFFLLMYGVFQFVFRLGNPPMDWIEAGIAWLSDTLVTHWPTGPDSALLSLLTDGILGGVGGVIVFLPNILLLFLAIAALEDSGYMARAAYVMDAWMTRIGLHGKSFIPMLLGFGCTVPAVMATRTLEHHRDRLATMLVLPLMSCGARLTIYALFIPAFFPLRLQAPVLMTVYLIGVALAVLGARLLRRTLLRGETMPLVMELPPYRLPTLKSVMVHMSEQAGLYLRKAGTIILALSVILWAMTTYPRKPEFDRDYEAEAAAADAAYDTARAAWVGGEVEAFEAMVERVMEIRGVFDERLDGAAFEETNPAHLVFRHDRDAQLARLEAENPARFHAAVRYLDDVRDPWRTALVDLDHARQTELLTYALSGRIGQRLEPVLRPLGFDWRIGTALIGAFAAKEVFVAQLGIVFAVGEADEESPALRDRLRDRYSPLTAFAVMIFCLVSMPCVATVAIVRQESGSWRWALGQAVLLTLLAYVLTLLVYQGGLLLGFG